MQADDGAWIQPLEQSEECARFRFRRRFRAWTQRDVACIVRPSLVTDRIGTPIGCWKVPVQIHASAVAASSAQHSVGVAAENDGGLQIATENASQRFGNDDRRLRFVSVDGSEDDDLGSPIVRKISSEGNSLERCAVDRRRVPDHSSIAPLHKPLVGLTIHIIGRGLCGIAGDRAVSLLSLPGMIRRALFLWIFVLFSLALACAVGELYVRWQGWRDIDGTFYFRDRPIRPYVIPLNGARTLIDRYLHDSSGSLLYDPDLGWNNRPHASTPGRMQSTNSFGLRADREYTHEMRPGMFRVSMFGDSFIFGADVDLQDSPAVRLEGLLKQRGIDAEVLNFGVGGFGFDQAYLHYHRDSSQ